MTSREWFAVAVRVIGVWTLLGALTSWVSVHNVVKGFFQPQSTSLAGYLLHAAVDTAAGLYLLLGASHLASLLYRNESAERSAETDPPEPTS
jgi:hypothetical protein